MKVLLTGANGFVGSHVLDLLHARRIPTAVLLRPTAQTGFIDAPLQDAEKRVGSLDDGASLRRALRDVTHVIHCAGSTKAREPEEFFRVNQVGTRNLVAAINEHQGQVRRLVHLSSLAAAGPAVAEAPSREDDPPRPVSTYGHSKLAGEREVREGCRAEYVVLRPPAVYGPRDAEFLRLFGAVKAHLGPSFGGGHQALSLVFVKDLAHVLLTCLDHPAAVGRVYNVAPAEMVTSGQLVKEIAAVMKRWTLPLPLPRFMLWPLCVVQEVVARLTRRPSVLNRQKYAELRAAGWVCDPGRLQRELGLACPTRLREGLAQTLAWYQEHRWV